jgi:hypothetical protein
MTGANLWSMLNALPTTTSGVLVAQYISATALVAGPLQSVCAFARDSLCGAGVVNFGNPSVYAQIQAIVAAFLAAGVVTQATANSILLSTQHPSRLDEILGTTNARLDINEFISAIS